MEPAEISRGDGLDQENCQQDRARQTGEIITEFLKPGVDEWCSVLPGWLARPILRAADRGGWRRRLNVGLHVRTSSVSGFLLMWTLARLRRLRRGMHRFGEEQGRIETWLGRVGEAYAASPALAVEVAKCANLVKGYGDTHERGVRNFERTMACLAACTAASDPAGVSARSGRRRSPIPTGPGSTRRSPPSRAARPNETPERDPRRAGLGPARAAPPSGVGRASESRRTAMLQFFDSACAGHRRTVKGRLPFAGH